MKFTTTAFLVIAVISLLVLSGAFYTVNETQQVIKTRFGEPIGEPVTDAGLHFKVPFIDTIHYMDKRILEWDGYKTEINTAEKKFIWVDTTARWKIVNALEFYKTVYNEEGAQSKLDDVIDSVVRTAVTENPLGELVRNTNRIMDVVNAEDQFTEGQEELKRGNLLIQKGREAITREMVENAKPLVAEYGLELIDIRIKRINYTEGVRKDAYQKMISERQKIASRFRSEGEGKRAEIRGQMDKELKLIESEAYRRAQEIKGTADATATRIYADAYNKDPEFYSFIETLEAYKETTSKNSRLILTTDSDFYKYLKGINP